MSDHRARYKNTGLDAKELRRRREEDSIQLRKQKRDDVLSKKRTLAPVEPDITDLDDSEPFGSLKTDHHDIDTSVTQEMIAGIMQDVDMVKVLENARKVRKILSKEPQPPFDEVIQSGLVSRVVQLLDRDDEPSIQFEVAWILTNICSGTSEQTSVVVDSGATPKLVRLLQSRDLRLCEQAIWALGNIVGEGAKYRDLVISYNFLPALVTWIRPGMEVGFLRNATWVLVNICRNKDPPPDIEVIRQLIPSLLFLVKSTDIAILTDIVWAVSYITELGTSYSQLIIDYGIAEQMTYFLSHDEGRIQTAAIRALGCITTGSDEQTQAVIDAGAIPHLLNILRENKEKVAKEVLWFLSNISAGSQDQVQALIDNRAFPLIIDYLKNGDYPQQKEASWTIFNLCLSGTQTQLRSLVDEEVIPPLCDLLSLKDTGVIRNVLEALFGLLKNCDSEDDHTVREQIEACGGLDKIEALQSNNNQEIYQFAYSIIDQFFNTDPNE